MPAFYRQLPNGLPPPLHFYKKILTLSPLWFFKNLKPPTNKERFIIYLIRLRNSLALIISNVNAAYATSECFVAGKNSSLHSRRSTLRKTFMDAQLLQKIEATVYLKREVTTFAVKEVKIFVLAIATTCHFFCRFSLRVLSFTRLTLHLETKVQFRLGANAK